jgi:uncharacterized protein (DUF2141 family)
MRTLWGRSAVLAAAVLVMALMRCTGIETTNGVTVIASSSSISGSVPPHASVSLFDTAYIPFIGRGISRAVTVGETGDFVFDGLLPGSYNVIVSTPDERDAALVPRIAIEASVVDSQYRATLEPVGSVHGSITNVPDTIAEVLIYLEGTGYYARMPGTGTFTINQVSAGTYSLRISEYSFSDTIMDRNGILSRETIAVNVSPDGIADAGTIVLEP